MNLKKVYIPIINKKGIKDIIDRDNGEKFIVANIYGNGARLALNETGTMIFERCDGVSTIDDIVDYICSKYKSVDKKVIEKDTLSLLYSLWNIDAISWKKDNPFNEGNEKGISNEITFRKYTHHDRDLVNNYVKKSYLNPKYMANTFNIISIQKQMFLKVCSFYSMKVNGIEVFTIYSGMLNREGILDIYAMYVNNDYLSYIEKHLDDFKKYIIEDQKNKSIDNFNKDDSYKIIVSIEASSQIKENIDKLNTSYLGTLKREFGNKDMEVYTL